MYEHLQDQLNELHCEVAELRSDNATLKDEQWVLSGFITLSLVFCLILLALLLAACTPPQHGGEGGGPAPDATLGLPAADTPVIEVRHVGGAAIYDGRLVGGITRIETRHMAVNASGVGIDASEVPAVDADAWAYCHVLDLELDLRPGLLAGVLALFGEAPAVTIGTFLPRLDLRMRGVAGSTDRLRCEAQYGQLEATINGMQLDPAMIGAVLSPPPSVATEPPPTSVPVESGEE